MTTNEYLSEVLKSQNLDDGSKELKELQMHRADVEKLLRDKFEDSSPTIRYGGSRAKGTLILESYDLDIICYFPSKDISAGESLEDIYNNVRKALEEKYYVTPKTSALRLKSKDPVSLALDFHVDVVPGRYVDGNDGDCFIFQSNAEKMRMKTNLDVHINHVKKSGVVDAIRLLKLWKTRKAIPVKQFVWELLIIKLLKGKTADSLSDQLENVWAEIINSKEPITVEDPANPNGNDLSPVLSEVWSFLSSSSDATMKLIENSGWEAVFGTTKKLERYSRVEALTQAASAATVRTKPWASEVK
jgi:hypothetical protein